MTHTPGPWHQANTVEIWGGPSTVKHVAHCGNRKQDTGSALKSVDEVSANAQLIAAAPELLEALKGLQAYAAMNQGTMSARQRDLLDAARAAIAKAEGKQ